MKTDPGNGIHSVWGVYVDLMIVAVCVVLNRHYTFQTPYSVTAPFF